VPTRSSWSRSGTSLRLYLRSLAHAGFFLQLAWYNEWLAGEPLQDKMRGFAFARTHRHLDAWRSSRTGYPLIDAGIRELRATGWMHPRVRAIAASFLCFDLGVDWRIGRDEWDHYLTEDEPVLAAGNGQWIAGVGADLAAYPRIYNPLKQARRFDPAATYVRRWLPELAGFPDAAILDPVVGRDGRPGAARAAAVRCASLPGAGRRPRGGRPGVPRALRAGDSAGAGLRPARRGERAFRMPRR
jgi:deoxyribodipyrimidine photo-lyase